MIKLIVFDFDGTLVNTKKMLLDIIEDNVEEFDYKLDKKFIHEFGDRPLELALDRLGVDEGVLPFLSTKIDIDFLEHVKKVKANRGLKSLAKIEKRKIILSNTFREFIELSLKKLNSQYFEQVCGAETPGDKYTRFREILKREKLDENEVIYVGDRVIDVVLARKIGCRCIIVANESSWSSKKELKDAKPDFIVDSLDEIKKIVEKID